MMKNSKDLSGYTDDLGRFTRLPGKRQKRKLDMMLEVFIEKFNYEQRYSELEVNDLLNKQHTFGDPATIRRLLFGCGYLDRTKDGREYWRIAEL